MSCNCWHCQKTFESLIKGGGLCGCEIYLGGGGGGGNVKNVGDQKVAPVLLVQGFREESIVSQLTPLPFTNNIF